MKAIRSIILDFGGVISQPQNETHIEKMLKILNLKPTDFEKVYRKFRNEYDSGEFSGEDYWAKISNHYRCKLNKNEVEELISEDVKSWTKINENMLSFIMDVRKRVYNLSIISNMPVDLLDYMRIHFDWLDVFDELIFSCELGITKPDPSIFNYCINKIEVSPNECLFVDDTLNNVNSAKNIGLNTIHFNSFEKFSEELKRDYKIKNI